MSNQRILPAPSVSEMYHLDHDFEDEIKRQSWRDFSKNKFSTSKFIAPKNVSDIDSRIVQFEEKPILFGQHQIIQPSVELEKETELETIGVPISECCAVHVIHGPGCACATPSSIPIQEEDHHVREKPKKKLTSPHITTNGCKLPLASVQRKFGLQNADKEILDKALKSHGYQDVVHGDSVQKIRKLKKVRQDKKAINQWKGRL